MKKILKVEVDKVIAFGIEKIFIKVIEQSHKYKEFGKDGSHSFVASNGLTIESFGMPDFDIHGNILNVRGNMKAYDNRAVFIPKDYYKKVMYAIAEYNTFFSKEAKPKVRMSLYERVIWNTAKAAYKTEVVDKDKVNAVGLTEKEWIEDRVQQLHMNLRG